MRHAAQAAQCMVDVLKASASYADARVEAFSGYGGEMALVVYDVHAPNGRMFHREVEVYENSNRTFSVGASEGVTRQLFEAWRRCGVVTIQVSPL
jgi:hypothetical protein